MHAYSVVRMVYTWALDYPVYVFADEILWNAFISRFNNTGRRSSASSSQRASHHFSGVLVAGRRIPVPLFWCLLL